MGTEDVAVVMAYRDMGVPERRRSFDHVRSWYLAQGLPVTVEAGQSDETFTRASAINAGIGRTDAAVIVQADPDNLVSAAALRIAIALARSSQPGLVFPHDRWLRLTPAATEALLAGHRQLADMGLDDCELWGPDAPGGVVVFSRETWARSGGFDERFGLWGGDDAAFAYAAEAFCGLPRRIVGDVMHLWHPILPQAEIGSPGYVEQFALLAQYRDAAAVGPAEVRALVASRGQAHV